MITTKEINLQFNKGVAVVQINVPHLVKTITIKGIAVGASTIISMVITAPNLLPYSNDIVAVLRQDFGINRYKSSITHTFQTGSKMINGLYTFQIFDYDNTCITANLALLFPTIIIMEFAE